MYKVLLVKENGLLMHLNKISLTHYFQKNKERNTKYAFNILLRDITEEEINVNIELFQKYFKFTKPSLMLKILKNVSDKERNNDFESWLTDLEGNIKKTSEYEKRIEEPERVVGIVEEILKFIRQDQKREGLKILTPYQMVSRLPISLTQLKARNKSKKLKMEIRQLLYSLYCSKRLTKTIHNDLINTI